MHDLLYCVFPTYFYSVPGFYTIRIVLMSGPVTLQYSVD